MKQFTTSASGKIILFGEHSVVYGCPAIAVPISNIRAYATVETDHDQFLIIAEDLKNQYIALSLDTTDRANPLTKIVDLVLKQLKSPYPNVKITLKSDIPIASGLGSGAAVSTALGKAIAMSVNKTISLNDLNSLVFEVEKIHHGTPSGIDNTVITYEKPIYYIKEKSIDFLNIQSPFHIVVADTGDTALTHESVGDVRKLYHENPHEVGEIFKKIQNIAENAMIAMDSGNLVQLGKLMTKNHWYLQQLTVSSEKLDHLVESAMQAGALGAKLSGGGRGGNMIALVEKHELENVKNALQLAGAVKVFDSLVK